MNYRKHISIIQDKNIYNESHQFKQRLRDSSIVQYMFSQIKKIKTHLLQHIRVDVNTEPDVSIKKCIHTHLNSNFISTQIQNDIIDNVIGIHTYTFHYNSNTIVFYNFLYKRKQYNVSYKQLIIMACYGYIIMELYHKTNITLNTYIYPSTYKKIFPSKPPITVENINSGYTTISDIESECYIVLFRKEDVENVFIHECIHYLKIDTNLYVPYTHIHTAGLQDFFKFNHHILLNEGYTEALTILYTSLCNAIFLGVDYETILYNEFLYSIVKCNNILQLYSISNSSEFHKWSNDRTNSFAYVYIKTICLENMDSFLQHFLKHSSIHPQSFIQYISQQYRYIEPYVYTPIHFKSNILNRTFKKNIYAIKW